MLSQQEGNRIEANVPHRCRRAQGDARRRSMRARYLFLSSRAARALRHLTTRNATRTCKIYVGLPPRTVREPVRPRVTEQCVSPSLHSASQSVGPGRKAVRKAVWPPKPTANQEARMDATHMVTKKKSKAVRFGQCEPLPFFGVLFGVLAFYLAFSSSCPSFLSQTQFSVTPPLSL